MDDKEHDVGEPLTARGSLGEMIRETSRAAGFVMALKYPAIDTTLGLFRIGQLQGFARSIGIATAVPSFTTEMARMTDTVAKLGIASKWMEQIGTSSAFAKIAADNLNIRDLVSGPRTGDWVQHIPVNPVPALLRELNEEIAQAHAAETARADAAEQRAERAEKRANAAHWMTIGMFVIAIASLILTFVAIVA